jgi:phosphatidylserine decarboxylase
VRLPIARQGWPFILPLLGLAVIGLMTFPIGGGVVLVLAAFVTYFFRDPERTIPAEPGLFLSPADGQVVGIEPHAQGPDGRAGTRLSIFLSILDVHINRAPLAGTVLAIRYQPGKFMPAFRSEAGAGNEQNVVTLRAGPGQVVVKQIAGILARRIVCWVKPGDTLSAGERFGLIRFGSRVEVLIPADFEVRAQQGQKVRGGESILAAAERYPAALGHSRTHEPGRTHP